MAKIKRNALCPCGSGKKFKHCHLGREEELFAESEHGFPLEVSRKITALPEVNYGRCRHMAAALDIEKLTGFRQKVRFVDLAAYRELGSLSGGAAIGGREEGGGVVVNIMKTEPTDPHHVYVAISPEITESALAHQLAHVLDYLGGSRLMAGVTRPLSYDLGIPVEHLEHCREFGYWLAYVLERLEIQPDADDSIIVFLYENEKLIRGLDIEQQKRQALQGQSQEILRFLSEKSAEIDARIRDLPGYIGSRRPAA